MRPDQRDIPPTPTLKALAKAFNLLKYDVAFVANDEARALRDRGVELDMNRHSAKEVSVTTHLVDDKDTVSFIRFPSLPEGNDLPSKQLIREIAQAVKEQRESARLIIGLSGWGWVGEREYLAQNPVFVPDILLGSSRGSGVNRIEANGRCIWVRPYDKGRTVSEIQIYSWPDRSGPFAWKEPESVKTLSTGLGDQYHDHPDVSALLP